MDKKVLVGAAAGCAAVTAVIAAKNRPAGPKPTMWDKVREGMEEMPEDFPPRVMFDNVESARNNTEEILERLERLESLESLESNESTKDDIELIHTS